MRVEPVQAVYRTERNMNCLKVAQTVNKTTLITFDILNGFVITVMPNAEFNARYKLLPGFPVDKCAKLFFNYMRHIGATKDVIDWIGKFTKISTSEKVKILKIRENIPVKPVDDTPEPKIKTPSRKQITKPIQPVGDGKVVYKSAAAMFRGLIQENTLSDDDIFKHVQQQFNLPDNRRSYVNYYRRELKRKAS